MSCYWLEGPIDTQYPGGGSVLLVDIQNGQRVGRGLCIEARDDEGFVAILLNREQVTHLCSQLTRALETWK